MTNCFAHDMATITEAIADRANYLIDIADGDTFGELNNPHASVSIRQEAMMLRGLAREAMRVFAIAMKSRDK